MDRERGSRPPGSGIGSTKPEVSRSSGEWRAQLSDEQFRVLREAGTERAFTSPLYLEKRPGTYVCAGCEAPLFSSASKYESGTGWPSFFESIEGAVGTRHDLSLLMPRTEYHCARCGGHHGHVFPDGPKPTGQRYCNNGVSLRFVPDSSEADAADGDANATDADAADADVD
jgi:peptide-methionine (R)-S-oxide reductase